FEGGQMPLFRRLPKFVGRQLGPGHQKKYRLSPFQLLPLHKLNACKEGDTVCWETLQQKGVFLGKYKRDCPVKASNDARAAAAAAAAAAVAAVVVVVVGPPLSRKRLAPYGDGELRVRGLQVKAHAFTRAAARAIIRLGGRCLVLQPKTHDRVVAEFNPDYPTTNNLAAAAAAGDLPAAADPAATAGVPAAAAGTAAAETAAEAGEGAVPADAAASTAAVVAATTAADTAAAAAATAAAGVGNEEKGDNEAQVYRLQRAAGLSLTQILWLQRRAVYLQLQRMQQRLAECSSKLLRSPHKKKYERRQQNLEARVSKLQQTLAQVKEDIQKATATKLIPSDPPQQQQQQQQQEQQEWDPPLPVLSRIPRRIVHAGRLPKKQQNFLRWSRYIARQSEETATDKPES
ncbi:ribosomal protein L15, putative, partial [Eimeria acervulina]